MRSRRSAAGNNFLGWRLAHSNRALVDECRLRVAASWLNDLVAHSDHDGLGAGHCTQLSTEMLDVFLDGSAADVKRLAYFPPRLADGDQCQEDFPLTRRQACRVPRRWATKSEDSVKRIDRHEVQGWQLVLGQIERPASEPYLTCPACR